VLGTEELESRVMHQVRLSGSGGLLSIRRIISDDTRWTARRSGRMGTGGRLCPVLWTLAGLGSHTGAC
jgi:hypothetical protein